MSTAHDNLESMWCSHQRHVRCSLIGLARDADLADDLLQETYLHAWRGISNYRGGDARAWLCAIAKNVFYSHIRQARIGAEVHFDGDMLLGEGSYVGSDDHIGNLDLRNLLSKLPDDLRTALVMKHHMGLTYPEIARRTDCAAITARTRMHRAISLIRSALDEGWKPAGPVCSGMSTDRIIDYIYHLLRPESMEAVEAHMCKCDQCRERVGEIRALVRAMDTLPCDYRQMQLLDVDDRGVPRLHVASGSRNQSGRSLNSLSFRAWKESGVRSLAVPGTRLSYDAAQSMDYPGLIEYTADLPHATVPGQDVRCMMTFGPMPARRAVRTGSGTYRLYWDQSPSYTGRSAYTQVIRLPKGARLVSSNPAPADVITNGCTTLVWSSDLMPSERFRSTVEYSMVR